MGRGRFIRLRNNQCEIIREAFQARDTLTTGKTPAFETSVVNSTSLLLGDSLPYIFRKSDNIFSTFRDVAPNLMRI